MLILIFYVDFTISRLSSTTTKNNYVRIHAWKWHVHLTKMNISNKNRYDFNFSSVLNVIKSSGIGLRWIFAREYEIWSTIYGKLNQVQYYYCPKYHIPWGQYCWPCTVNLNKGLTNVRTRCDLDGFICLK